MLELNTIKKKFNKGDIFFIADFKELGSYETIRKSLPLLTTENEIGRIVNRIYLLQKKKKHVCKLKNLFFK